MSLREIIIQARKFSRERSGDSLIVELECLYCNIIIEILDDIYRNPDVQNIMFDFDTKYEDIPKLIVSKLEGQSVTSSWCKIGDETYRINIHLPI